MHGARDSKTKNLIGGGDVAHIIGYCQGSELYIKCQLNFPTTRGFRIKISMKLVYKYIKPSSSTTSRELRQQFAVCSG